MPAKHRPAEPLIPDGPGIGPWEICEDPHCNHSTHGSLRRVVDIMLRIQERVRQQNPAEYAAAIARAQTRA